MEENESTSKDNVIRKNMVQKRTQMFEVGGTTPDSNEDRTKNISPNNMDKQKPAIDTNRPKLITPKPKLPQNPVDKPNKIVVNDAPKLPVSKRAEMFEQGAKDKDTKNKDNSAVNVKQFGPRKLLSDHNLSHASGGLEVLTESQVVRPKTTTPPVYSQVDKNKKLQRAKPPKPTIPKIDRMRGRPASDTSHQYGIVYLPSDTPTSTPKPLSLTPPAKPPRTFAHDEYLKVKAEKKRKSLEDKLNKDNFKKETDDMEKEQHSPKLLLGTNKAKTDAAKSGLIEGGKPGLPTTKPPIHTKPPPKPQRPNRPPSLAETANKPSPLTVSTDSNGYQKIDDFVIVPDPKQTNNGDVCHYEEVDSSNITFRDKRRFQRSTSIPEQRLSPHARPKSKPPPPPRPPLPSNTDDEGGEVQASPAVIEAGAGDNDSRWDKGFVRITKHNTRLGDEDFITQPHFRNPSYGKKNSIIAGKIMSEEAALKRFKSDECLYAEIDESGKTTWELQKSEAIYHDPIDLIPSSHDQKGGLTEHGVIVDSEGYAIPDTNRHTLGHKVNIPMHTFLYKQTCSMYQ